MHMDEIIIEHNEQYHFQKVYCSEGHFMTDWNEGDDILEYNASQLIYVPDTYDVKAHYHCITEEQHQEYRALQEEKMKELDPTINTEEIQ